MATRVVNATQATPEALRAAVRGLIEGQSVGGRLRRGAEAVAKDGEEAEARYFQSILELAYLVASADGLAEEEKSALADLLAQVTGSALDSVKLQLHFDDLEQACAALGRKERLRRAAADFEDTIGRSEALGFAALVAAADGELDQAELDALSELGSQFELGPTEVDRVVYDVVQELARALGGEERT